MTRNRFPPGWNQERVQRVLAHYENQSEVEAIAEDEASYEDPSQTYMEIPNKLLPEVCDLIARRTS